MIRNIMVGVAALVLALSQVSPVLADIKSDNGPGCGLGKLLWSGAGSGQNKIVQQVLAATTNGTFGNQTFGITSGTSGCTNDGLVKNDQKVIVFASINFDNLKQDMARGQGEYLASLAELMDVSAKDQAGFFVLTQENFATIFASEETTPSEMLSALKQTMSAHPILVAALDR